MPYNCALFRGTQLNRFLNSYHNCKQNRDKCQVKFFRKNRVAFPVPQNCPIIRNIRENDLVHFGTCTIFYHIFNFTEKETLFFTFSTEGLKCHSEFDRITSAHQCNIKFCTKVLSHSHLIFPVTRLARFVAVSIFRTI